MFLGTSASVCGSLGAQVFYLEPSLISCKQALISTKKETNQQSPNQQVCLISQIQKQKCFYRWHIKHYNNRDFKFDFQHSII
jgi:hypothetical protein